MSQRQQHLLHCVTLCGPGRSEGPRRGSRGGRTACLGLSTRPQWPTAQRWRPFCGSRGGYGADSAPLLLPLSPLLPYHGRVQQQGHSWASISHFTALRAWANLASVHNLPRLRHFTTAAGHGLRQSFHLPSPAPVSTFLCPNKVRA